MKKYFKTEIGVLKKLYHHMKERSKKNNWSFTFSFDEFKEWAYKNNFKDLFDYWEAYEYTKILKPSIDRIDEYGIYEFSNMQIITWHENWKDGQLCKKNIESYTKTFYEQRKKVQYAVVVSKGKYKHIFQNINEVIEQFPFMSKSKISACCNGKRKHHHGFTFNKIKKEVVAL